jgi:3-oxoacyl-[acyl-carrier-protein] synthase-3
MSICRINVAVQQDPDMSLQNKNLQRIQAKIADFACFLPSSTLSNDELAALYPDWPADKIYSKTGIRNRHIAAKDQTASDLAYEAALNLFKQSSIQPQDVDFVILCTQAPDHILPTSACILQERLGISRHSGALDINLGCSGYVYGLSLAKGLVETGAARCVLFLTADTYSKYIHPLDKSVRTLFGDGATATAIIASQDVNPQIYAFEFGTDGRGAKNLIVPAGLYRTPRSVETHVETVDQSGNTRSQEHLYMNGAEVMTFSLTEVPRAFDAVLNKAGCIKDDIDYFVFHQANKFMLEALRKKLAIPAEKMPILVEECGNTVSSSIPMALTQMKEQGQLKAGAKLLLMGFGVGYSWAGCVVHL